MLTAASSEGYIYEEKEYDYMWFKYDLKKDLKLYFPSPVMYTWQFVLVQYKRPFKFYMGREVVCPFLFDVKKKAK